MEEEYVYIDIKMVIKNGMKMDNDHDRNNMKPEIVSENDSKCRM